MHSIAKSFTGKFFKFGSFAFSKRTPYFSIDLKFRLDFSNSFQQIYLQESTPLMNMYILYICLGLLFDKCAYVLDGADVCTTNVRTYKETWISAPLICAVSQMRGSRICIHIRRPMCVIYLRNVRGFIHQKCLR